MKKIFFSLILLLVISLELRAECSSNLSKEAFKTALDEVQKHNFDAAKKKTIEALFEKCLTSLQVKQLLQELSFEEDKITLAKKGFNYVSDPENYGVLKEIFDFEESKDLIDELGD
jgi:hypothetical protein